MERPNNVVLSTAQVMQLVRNMEADKLLSLRWCFVGEDDLQTQVKGLYNDYEALDITVTMLARDHERLRKLVEKLKPVIDMLGQFEIDAIEKHEEELWGSTAGYLARKEEAEEEK